MSYKTQMHGGGESYSGVVPTKRSNEGLGRPKEIVEGRLPTKENMEQPNSRRTQSRESEPSGLDRVRASEVGTVCVMWPHHLASDAMVDRPRQLHTWLEPWLSSPGPSLRRCWSCREIHARARRE